MIHEAEMETNPGQQLRRGHCPRLPQQSAHWPCLQQPDTMRDHRWYAHHLINDVLF